MSSDLERQLRDARESLPAPGEDSTLRARRHVLATIRRGRTRTRVLVLAGAMLVAAVVLGVTAGSLTAPSVTAAREPAVLGFVPEPGWFALQSPPPSIEGQQTMAVAANVPFAADDVDHGLVEPSGLPYSTLLTLPPDGIVIVVTMTPQTEPHIAPIPTNPYYARLELPLRFQDAIPYVQWGAQVRPDEPLAQFQLRGEIDGINTEVTIYLGTARPTSELRAAVQRQLERLVIRSKPSPTIRAASTTTPTWHTVSVIDRTYTCNTVFLGGLYQIEARAHAGLRTAGQWSKLPYAVVLSGSWAGLVPGNLYPRHNSLAWITAGRYTRETTVDSEGEREAFPVATGGTLGVNRDLCRPARVPVPLRAAGLQGGRVSETIRAFKCDAPKRVFVRIRAAALSNGPLPLRERAGTFLATSVPIRDAQLAVRTPAGRLVAYAAVDQSGKARQYTAKGCTTE